MTQRHSRRWAKPALAMTIGAGIAATSLLAIAAPGLAEAGSDDRLRVWTGAHGSAVGTGLASESCDFTGDGKEDILTSDWLWERDPFGVVGAVYVIPNGTASGQLDDPQTGITRIEGPQKDLEVGFRLNCAGDVNGDGFDDVLIDESNSSRVWVVFGNAQPENISLEFLGDRGFAIDRDVDIDGGVDTYTAGLGDLDGDGFDDIAIVSPKANGESGQVTVVKGRNDIATVHTENDDEVLMRINGATTPGLNRVQNAGDVDGDGINDLIIGAPDAPTTSANVRATGSAWVVSGANRGEINLADDFDGFTIEGPSDRKNRLGMLLASTGDLNGDGLADVLVGAPGIGVEGGVAVILGSTSHETVYTDPSAANGYSAWSGDASAPTDRGWWIHDSATGKSNLLGFTLGADPASNDHVGTLVIGIFIKNMTIAIPSTALGEEPVIDLTKIDPDQKATYSQELSYLGRAVSVVQDFGDDSCTQIALGGRDENREGTVTLYAIPWADQAPCAAVTEPTDPVDPTDPTDPKDPADPTEPTEPTEPTDPKDHVDDVDHLDHTAPDPESDTEVTDPSKTQGSDSDQASVTATPHTAHTALSTTGATLTGWLTGGVVLVAIGAVLVATARKKKTR